MFSLLSQLETLSIICQLATAFKIHLFQPSYAVVFIQEIWTLSLDKRGRFCDHLIIPPLISIRPVLVEGGQFSKG